MSERSCLAALTLVQVFSMRSMASGGAIHRAYYRATQQAFLRAHKHSFHYFQGVFRILRYDYVPGHINHGRQGNQKPAL
jgi:transposase